MSQRSLPSPPGETPLLAWLLTALAPMSRTNVKDHLARGWVHVNGESITKYNHLVKPGDVLTISKHMPTANRDPHDAIVFEDDAIVVLDKPAGLLSVATEKEKLDTAFARLRDHLELRRAGRPYVVHRLDRETSGLLLFAKSPEIREVLQGRWDQVRKTYLAVVEGSPREQEGVVSNFLLEGQNMKVRVVSHGGGEAKLAVSRYRVLREKRNLRLMEVQIDTGRKHQIRVHLASLGCPVIGDRLYGSTCDLAGRLGLHAWKLAFDHPANNRRLEIEAKVPGFMKRLFC